MITGILKHYTLDWFGIFVLPFIIVLFICIFQKSFKLDAILFFAITQLCILAGEWGNLSAALFLCFSIYCIEYKEAIYMIIAFTLLTIVLKFVFLRQNSTIIEMALYCIGMAYALIIYYVLIHPKQKFHLEEDMINTRILGYLIQGLKNKEIAAILNLSYNAVAKRIDNMRDKYRCGNNEQMIFQLIKNGGMRQN